MLLINDIRKFLFWLSLLFVLLLSVHCTQSSQPSVAGGKWALKLGQNSSDLLYDWLLIQGHYYSLPVYYSGEMNSDLESFSIQIAANPRAFQFIEAVPAEILDGWDLFTYNSSEYFAPGADTSLTLIHIHGRRQLTENAKSIDDNLKSLSSTNGENIVLFNLKFFLIKDLAYECQYHPFYFYWKDCIDNSLTFGSGRQPSSVDVYNIDHRILSQGYYDFHPPGGIIDPDDNIYGPFTGCGYSGSSNKQGAVLSAAYYHGGASIACIGADSPMIGDMNMNSIANEVDDAVVFSNYFVYGEYAFKVNLLGQIQCSDINRDGRFLTVADLVYLLQIIAGKAKPIEQLEHFQHNAMIYYDLSDIIIACDVDLGGALIVFEGRPQIIPFSACADMRGDSSDVERRILLAATDKPVYSFGVNRVLRLDRRAKIKYFEAAAYDGSMVNCRIMQ